MIIAVDGVMRGSQGIIRWQAPVDLTVAGFYVDRLNERSGAFDRVTPLLIESSQELAASAWYEAPDPLAYSGVTNTYRIVEITTDGRQLNGVPVVLVFKAITTSGVSALSSTETAPMQSGGLSPAAVTNAIPGDRVKIQTTQAGMYGVSAEVLAANLAGATTNDMIGWIAAGGLRLTCGTNEMAWLPMAGNTGIIFYATAVDSIYTRQNVYWMSLQPGATMSVANVVAPTQAVEGISFRNVVHVEDDRAANPLIFQDPEADLWLGVRVIVNTNKTTATNLVCMLSWAQSGEGTLKVVLKGSSTLASTPPHHARISLNGQLLGAMDWGGYGVCDSTFAATNWLSGTNIVKVEGYSQAGESDGATFYVDWMEASFNKLFMASSNSVWCDAGSNAVVSVGGFTRDDILVFDVTDPLRPAVLDVNSLFIESAGAGQWRVSFAPESAGRQYFVIAGDLMTPVRTVGRPDPQWSIAPHAADYVVIYHDSLRDGANALVSYRQSKGLSSLGIDVEDLYDEYSHGLVTPFAIQSFLKDAKSHWTRAPGMVALAGAGNYDYWNIRKTTSDLCLIPPVMVSTPDGLIGVDMPIGDTDADGVPDVVIGRLSLLTSNQMWEAVRKIMTVEVAVTNVNAVSLVTDANDPGLGPDLGDFAKNSDSMAAFINPSYTRDINYGSGTSSMTIVHERFVEQLNQPRTLVTYMGHANAAVLGYNGLMLSATDLPRLTNSVPPVLLAMTCIFGRFSYPYSSDDDFSEKLVRKSTGGVVAVWSCAGPSYSDDNTKMGSLLVKACFRQNGIRLGMAMKEAMVAYSREPAYRRWVLDTYSLLGDPALDLGLLNGEPKSYEDWRKIVFSEEQQGDPAVSDPLADPDHDGSVNQEEYAAGTLPSDAGSRLWISAVAVPGQDQCVIRWPSASNRLYTVEWSTNGMATFQERAGYLWATQPDNVYTDRVGVGVSPVFYRVKLVDMP